MIELSVRELKAAATVYSQTELDSILVLLGSNSGFSKSELEDLIRTFGRAYSILRPKKRKIPIIDRYSDALLENIADIEKAVLKIQKLSRGKRGDWFFLDASDLDRARKFNDELNWMAGALGRAKDPQPSLGVLCAHCGEPLPARKYSARPALERAVFQHLADLYAQAKDGPSASHVDLRELYITSAAKEEFRRKLLDFFEACICPLDKDTNRYAISRRISRLVFDIQL